MSGKTQGPGCPENSYFWNASALKCLPLHAIKTDTRFFFIFSKFLEVANNGNIMETNKKEKEKNRSFLFAKNDYICEHFGYTAFLDRSYYGQETKIIIIIGDCGNRGAWVARHFGQLMPGGNKNR